MYFDIIYINQGIILGKPCIKGMGITIKLVLEKLYQGVSFEFLFDGYPGLNIEDSKAAIGYSKAILTIEVTREVVA